MTEQDMSSAATGMFPNTAAEMDALLGFEGERIPDKIIPPTPGRSKVEWKTSASVKIVYEQHPYHLNAPVRHRGPHWHLTTPAGNHTRHLPGDPFPNW
jgi:hypothetical protein